MRKPILFVVVAALAVASHAEAQIGVAGISCWEGGRYVFYEGRSTCPGGSSGASRRPREPDPPSPQELSVDAQRQGAYLIQQRRFAEAEQSFREAIRLNPSSASSYANLGSVLLELGRWDDAAAAYERSLQLPCPRCIPGNSYYGLGAAHFRAGRREQAEAAFRQAGNHPDAQRELQLLLAERRRIAEQREARAAAERERHQRETQAPVEAGEVRPRRQTLEMETTPIVRGHLENMPGSLFMGSVQGTINAHREFARQYPNEQPAIMSSLAAHLHLRGHYREALDAYRSFTVRLPLGDRTPPYAPFIARLEKRLEKLQAYQHARITGNAQASAAAAGSIESVACTAGGPYDRNRCTPATVIGAALPSGDTAHLVVRLPASAVSDPGIRQAVAWHQHLENLKTDVGEQLVQAEQQYATAPNNAIAAARAQTLRNEYQRLETDQTAATNQVEKRLVDLGLTWQE